MKLKESQKSALDIMRADPAWANGDNAHRVKGKDIYELIKMGLLLVNDQKELVVNTAAVESVGFQIEQIFESYHHLATYPADEILAQRGEEKKVFTVNGHDFTVNMDSQRYAVFAVSKKCACCGIEGTVMAMDVQHHGGKKIPPHFNLYAVWKGIMVLMTKDHVQARSNGGKDDLENYQTMCCVCNRDKGNRDISIEDLRKEARMVKELSHD
jgi:hypothetical protein